MVDMENLFRQWQNKPYNDYSTRLGLGYISKEVQLLLKEAFFAGFDTGYNIKLKHNAQEQLQK
jgi:hypothetical protein